MFEDNLTSDFKVSNETKNQIELTKLHKPNPPKSLLPREKTPLPDYTFTPGYGTMPVEIFPEVCSCGRPFGALCYDAAIERAKYGINQSGSDVFAKFANHHNLKLCCRTAILEPTISFVVSSDINAYVDNIKTSGSPYPSTTFPNIIPPPLLSDYLK